MHSSPDPHQLPSSAPSPDVTPTRTSSMNTTKFWHLCLESATNKTLSSGLSTMLEEIVLGSNVLAVRGMEMFIHGWMISAVHGLPCICSPSPRPGVIGIEPVKSGRVWLNFAPSRQVQEHCSSTGGGSEHEREGTCPRKLH
jgi:hypothetical protein